MEYEVERWYEGYLYVAVLSHDHGRLSLTHVWKFESEDDWEGILTKPNEELASFLLNALTDELFEEQSAYDQE